MNVQLLQFGLLCFVSIFMVTDPIGGLSVFVPMTSKLSHAESRRVAVRAALTAWVVLMVFALTGRLIFDLFGISVNSLRIAGGIVFFIMGYEMLDARLIHRPSDQQSVSEYIEDIAITPLGVPLIAGPAGITTVVVLANQASGEIGKHAVLIVAVSAVILLTLLLLISARRVLHALGPSANKILLRVMGLILMAFAVEFFFEGLGPMVQGMIK
jgi:multiple antibiotic resistance protein